ncbi:DsbA family protein [Psychromarinibacter halotolerans]|uniref:DsbA family protein n=1 Tax=Psychromarinibacter halotolerans TaxID=1775175 RepID=A0ABV7GXW5_9RHOB|nr:DsbA family protein [Psychromarinibacter halotolerans]MDF0598170.1 DsbA family protein [Psychromarinibacter halotolerans]
MKTRLPLVAALVAMTATPLAAFDLSQMTEEERMIFRSEVRNYLMDNPEVLLEAINVLEQRQAEVQAANDVTLVETNSDELFDDGYSWVGGNPDGDITIVEFMDYRCGYCRKAHPEVSELIESDGNIRYIVKEFPILGEQSVLASRFAIAVKAVEGDEAYGTVHDLLMTMRGEVTEEGLSAMSEEQGFDTPAVFDAMNSAETETIIAQNRALAQRMAISGTPSFIFESEMVRGYVPLDGMREILAEVRAEG